MQSTADIPAFNPCELAAIEDETTGEKEIHPLDDGPAFADVFDPALIIEFLQTAAGSHMIRAHALAPR
jgi:hypothetical protein